MLLGLLGLLALLWWLLDRHEARQAAAGLLARRACRVLRGPGAAGYALSGGCALLVFSNGESPYVNWELVALFSGPPFAIALLVWLLARKRWNRAA